jgi:Protein of unknown function (DUF998)
MRTRTLVNLGMLAGPVFVITYTIVGRRQSERGYLRRRDPVSSLVLGDLGAVQTASFLMTGTLTCASAIGLRRALRPEPGSAAIPLLIGSAGIGFVGAGIFRTDPVGERSLTASGLTRTGKFHVASAVPVFSCLPVACLLGARLSSKTSGRAWTLYSTASGVASVVAAALAGLGFAGNARFGANAGVFQRIALVSGLGWLGVLSALLSRRVR